jgi:plasmid stability protein
MPNLSIKNVPEDILEKLREQAALHNRSLQGELLALITAAATGALARASVGQTAPSYSVGRVSGHLSVQEAWAIASARPKPPIDMPNAVDIIRAARDGR